MTATVLKIWTVGKSLFVGQQLKFYRVEKGLSKGFFCNEKAEFFYLLYCNTPEDSIRVTSVTVCYYEKHRTNFLVVCTPLSFSQHLYLSLMTAISATTFRGPLRKSHLHHFILSSALLASNYPDANCSDRGQSKNDLACCFLSLLIDTYCTLML